MDYALVVATARDRDDSRYNHTVSAPITVTDTVRVPAGALSMRAVRASGPGGQNVNKVATKIDLRVDLGAIEGLSDAARARLHTLSRHRLDAEGRLVVTEAYLRDYDETVKIIVDDVLAGRRAADPALFVAVSQSPGAQLRCAQTYSSDKYPPAAALWRDI